MPEKTPSRHTITSHSVTLRETNGRATVAERRTPGRPTRAAAVQLRQDFIQTALSSFLMRGYAGTSIDALARESQVHKDTIYRQFGGKENIYVAAVTHAMARLRERLAGIRATSAAPDKVLLSFIQRIYTEMTRPEAVAVVRLTIAEAQQFPDLAEKLYNECGGNLDALVAYLADLSKAGRIDVDDPHAAAGQLALLTVDGTRFLMTRPYASVRARNAHARKVLALLLKAWSYS